MIVKSSFICAAMLLLACCSKPAPSVEKLFEQEVYKKVSYRLKDPDSAKFRNEISRIFPDKKLVCGEVNSKNSYRGYSGYQGFVYLDGSISFEEDNLDLFQKKYSKCAEADLDEAEKTIKKLEQIDPAAATKARKEMKKIDDL